VKEVFRLIAELWEWSVAHEPRNRPVGVCMTKHAAMEALSKALIAAGPSSAGHVVPMALVRPVQADPGYVRESPDRRAVYDGR
jgi:hypothetical protein